MGLSASDNAVAVTIEIFTRAMSSTRRCTTSTTTRSSAGLCSEPRSGHGLPRGGMTVIARDLSCSTRRRRKGRSEFEGASPPPHHAPAADSGRVVAPRFTRPVVCSKRALLRSKRSIVCSKPTLFCFKRSTVCSERTLVCSKRSIVYSKRALVWSKRTFVWSNFTQVGTPFRCWRHANAVFGSGRELHGGGINTLTPSPPHPLTPSPLHRVTPPRRATAPAPGLAPWPLMRPLTPHAFPLSPVSPPLFFFFLPAYCLDPTPCGYIWNRVHHDSCVGPGRADASE